MYIFTDLTHGMKEVGWFRVANEAEGGGFVCGTLELVVQNV